MDHAATTRIMEPVLREMMPYLTEQYGNPSAVYTSGVRAKALLSQARKAVADLIGAGEDDIYFTSGATESNNWVLRRIADTKPSGKHIITTAIEHPSVLNTCKALEKQGMQVSYIRPDKQGYIDPQDIFKEIRKETVLISVMTANNEIGTIEPIEEIGRIARKAGILFHTDAVQGIAHEAMDVDRMGLDYLSASAHKIGGPKGVGFLYMRKGKALPALLYGGSQEKERRAGTENVAGIAGLKKAVEILAENREAFNRREQTVRDYMMARLEKEISGCFINGSKDNRLPNNVHICLPQTEGKKIVLALNERGICAGFGSACSNAEQKASHVLKAIGLTHAQAFSGVRFTFDETTTIHEADIVVDALKQIMEQ